MVWCNLHSCQWQLQAWSYGYQLEVQGCDFIMGLTHSGIEPGATTMAIERVNTWANLTALFQDSKRGIFCFRFSKFLVVYGRVHILNQTSFQLLLFDLEILLLRKKDTSSVCSAQCAFVNALECLHVNQTHSEHILYYINIKIRWWYRCIHSGQWASIKIM